MKVFLLLLLLIGIAEAKAVWSDEARQKEAQQASMWRDKINESAHYTAGERLEFLSLGLKNIGYRQAMEGHSSEIVEVYNSLQEIFLTIPGHAKFFADYLEAQRDELKPGQHRSAYDTKRHWIIRQTLVHLPSPETVEVLGKYLFDERDDPPELWSPGQDAAPISGSGFLAMDALSKIGLRNPPVESEYSDSVSEDREMLETYRKWYEKVKSGEIPFAFIGQPVEYRFQPDGTVVSTPVEIPEDEREEAGTATREPVTKGPAGKKDPEASLAPARPFPWLWIGAVVLLATALLGFVKLKK